ncbi:hypothetical protein D3C72_1847740 [compost metagenome]
MDTVLAVLHEEHVAFGMGHIALDVAIVAGDVMRMGLEGAGMGVVDPADEFGNRRDARTMIVHRVLVIGASDHLLVVPVKATRVAIDAIEDFLPVQQILNLGIESVQAILLNRAFAGGRYGTARGLPGRCSGFS